MSHGRVRLTSGENSERGDRGTGWFYREPRILHVTDSVSSAESVSSEQPRDSSDDLSRVFGALHPKVTVVDLVATAAFDPQPEHRGVPGWLHGGMAATVLDHVSARCAAAALGHRVVTGRLDLRYRHPVPLDGGPYQLWAEASAVRRRTVRVQAAIRSMSGAELVGSKALFTLLPEDSSR